MLICHQNSIIINYCFNWTVTVLNIVTVTELFIVTSTMSVVLKRRSEKAFLGYAKPSPRTKVPISTRLCDYVKSHVMRVVSHDPILPKITYFSVNFCVIDN